MFWLIKPSSGTPFYKSIENKNYVYSVKMLFVKVEIAVFTSFRLGFCFCWNISDKAFVLNVYNISDILKNVVLVFKSGLQCITLNTGPL
jgi:hypothetical protein